MRSSCTSVPETARRWQSARKRHFRLVSADGHEPVDDGDAACRRTTASMGTSVLLVSSVRGTSRVIRATAKCSMT